LGGSTKKRKNYLKYLRIYGENGGNKFFNVSQRFDLYIIEKEGKGRTTIIDELGEKLIEDVTKWPFLPSYEYSSIRSILSTDGFDVIYSTIYQQLKPLQSFLSLEKNTSHHLPVIKTINSGGIEYIYTSKDKGHFNIPKLILSCSRYQYNFPEQNDYEGKYGMTQGAFALPIRSKKEGDQLLNAINSDKFKDIIKATKWGAFQTDYRMFKYFKKDFYKEFSSSGGSILQRNFTRKNKRKNIKNIKRRSKKYLN